MIIASFDIECSSSHGDFPLAKKNYKKLACEVYDTYKKEEKSMKKKDNKSNTSFIESLIRLGFENNSKNSKNKYSQEISRVYTLDDEKPENYRITKLSKIIYRIINTKENYRILTTDILKYFYDKDYPQVSMFKHKYLLIIQSIIEDAFTNEVSDKSNKMVNTIYTKTNSKPSKKLIETTSGKVTKQICLLFKKINKTLKDFEIDGDFISELIELFVKNSQETFQQGKL